jgi:hypothetical protein
MTSAWKVELLLLTPNPLQSSKFHVLLMRLGVRTWGLLPLLMHE